MPDQVKRQNRNGMIQYDCRLPFRRFDDRKVILHMNKTKYVYDDKDMLGSFAGFICEMIAKYGDKLDFDSLYTPFELRMRKYWKRVIVMHTGNDINKVKTA